MRRSLELLLGLLDRGEPVFLAWEDFAGDSGPAVRLWQRMGIVAGDPASHPAPACPYCEDGVPYRLGERVLCHRCRSDVDPRELLLWRLMPEAFFRWLAGALRLKGG